MIMRVLSVLFFLLNVVIIQQNVGGGGCDAFSFSNKKNINAHSLSQKSVISEANNNDQLMKMMQTRRETIKMPSQTPMVPWKVREMYGQDR
jgi:nitrate reductase cytochrome c-type subunit